MKRYKLEFIGNIINKVKLTSVLDVGCRDCYLKKLIPNDVDYFGCDIFQNEENSIEFVGDFQDLKFENKYDCVTALDVVEHVDNPYTLTDKIFNLSNEYVIITLPNIYNYSKKLTFLLNNSLGGKYDFDTMNRLDRHRWIMNYNQIVKFFISLSKKHDCDLDMFDLKIGFDSTKTKNIIFSFLNFILQKHNSVKTVVGVFHKK